MASSKGSDPNKTTRYITPTGKVPLLSAVDDEVDWTMVAIELRAFLKRFEGYEEALFETLVDLNARAEQKKRLGKNNALNIVIWWRCVLRTKLQCCKSESMRPLMLIFMLITCGKC